ncbi:MAG: 30S ribosome-binding factor RbfA [Candidatus Melainabacteria bacterium]
MSREQSGNNRQDKVRKALMREVSDIIAHQIKDPVLTNQVISVTDAEISPDMSMARIYVSIFGDDTVRQEIMAVLKAAEPKIRTLVGQRIRLRVTPKVEIRYDDSLERGSRITQLLEQIAQENL